MRFLVALISVIVVAGLSVSVQVKPLPPPSATAPTALVVHVGNEPSDLVAFEQWLGCPVDGVAIHTGQADWNDWSGSIGFQLERWRRTARRLYWSIPLIPEGEELSSVATGRHDAAYRRAATEIASATPGKRTIPIRTGWEFNTRYMPWASYGHERDFVAAFRRFVTVFRSVSPRFKFEWTPNIGGDDDPAASWPGDDVVDVIGMDAYYNTRWDSTDPDLAWQHNMDRRYGFKWLETFASEHGKPTAYAEWGVMSDNAAPYVADAAAWFARRHPVYQSYWDSDSSFRGKLSAGEKPNVGAAFRQAFGSCRKHGV